MSLTVREAGDADLDVVAQLLAELHDPPTVKADADAWRAMLSQPARTVLIAELDGEPAGTADLTVLPNITNGALPRANVENVAVTTWCRRRGVGRALMAEVEHRAIEAGCYKIMLMSALHGPERIASMRRSDMNASRKASAARSNEPASTTKSPFRSLLAGRSGLPAR